MPKNTIEHAKGVGSANVVVRVETNKLNKNKR